MNDKQNGCEKSELPLGGIVFAWLLTRIPGIDRETAEKLVRTLVFAVNRFWSKSETGRRRGLLALCAATVGLGALFYRAEIYVPSVNHDELRDLLLGNCWLGYDPLEFDPLYNANPSLMSLHRDLEAIRAAGFSGIVTFSSRGTLAEIPVLARLNQLAMIMGIWDPNDWGELFAARQQAEYVDAYSVGHNGLGKPGGYSISQLTNAIDYLKRHTNRPVSTTEEARFYSDSTLMHLGDWVFPDVHHSLGDLLPRTRVDAHAAVEAYLDQINMVADHAGLSGRHLLVKMVGYPWVESQSWPALVAADVVSGLLDRIVSPEEAIPVRLGIVWHGAFDSPWKLGHGFRSWDPYTGLFDIRRRPRPHATVITARCPQRIVR